LQSRTRALCQPDCLSFGRPERNLRRLTERANPFLVFVTIGRPNVTTESRTPTPVNSRDFDVTPWPAIPKITDSRRGSREIRAREFVFRHDRGAFSSRHRNCLTHGLARNAGGWPSRSFSVSLGPQRVWANRAAVARISGSLEIIRGPIVTPRVTFGPRSSRHRTLRFSRLTGQTS
jgi:hypothetical protein